MRSRSFIIVAAVLGVLVVGAVALYVYDSTRKDHIAAGVRVGGLDVGGLDRAQAERKVAGYLHGRLDEPIVVRATGHAFRLTPRQAGATFHVHQMVDEAVAASRHGDIFSRTWRDIRGKALHEDIPASVQYSRLVLARFVDRVERKVNQQPVDAHLDFHASGFDKVPGKSGVIIDSRALHNDVEAAILGRRQANVRVHAHKTEPKVKLADLARQYDTLIIIDRPSFKLRLYKHLKLDTTYSVAIGQAGYDTPAGIYHIEDKTVDPTWYVPHAAWAGSLAGQVIPGGSPQNPLKARWLGFGGGRGIHGTANDSSIGSAASHGCIRMHVSDVVQLYPRVPLNTPLYVA
ncbi:MAG: L,D-transpeptidase/peptidoglycan binding protein [Actinomycetota bacterium]|nr:L,D-transpeptidase/peptidoglycan binding protein [Actinomycetota bacterium]